jgi:iron complex outermembrane receptor protein
MEFVVDDRLRAGRDLSDRRTFERLSPKLGLTRSLAAGTSVYLNLATAFQVPTKSELTATAGAAGFNDDLAPQSARHAELGGRGELGRRGRWELGAFLTEVDDEILPRTVIDSVTIFGNVGETRHQGAEGSVDWLLPGEFALQVSYGWSDNVFRGSGPLRGHVLPGYPEHRGLARLESRRASGLNGSVAFERVGSIYLDDRNSARQAPYGLLSAGLSYGWRRLGVFVQGTNLTDERHAAWVAVNDPAGNYFFPAPGRQVTVGVNLGLGSGR